MGRWSNERRAQEAAKASKAASDAGRTLQHRQQESRAASGESTPKAAPPPGESPAAERPEGWRPPARNEPRRLAMEEIEARQARTHESVEQPPEPEIPEDLPPPTPEQMIEGGKFSQPEPLPEAGVSAPPPEAQTPPPIEMVRVKVDGEEFDAPKTEVEDAGGIKAYQIQKAGENRLKKANETLAESKRIQAQIAQWAMQNIRRQPQQPQVTQAEFIGQKLDAIRFGTPEEGAAALAEVMQRANPRMDPQAMMSQATNQAVVTMRRQNGVDGFKNEFSDIVTNPLLLKLSLMLENERLTTIDPNSILTFDWSDFYRKIGNEVRSVAGRQSQAATATPAAPSTPGTTSLPSDKEARKASIVNLPTAAARAELLKESKPETRDEILNQMRKSRGLPTG